MNKRILVILSIVLIAGLSGWAVYNSQVTSVDSNELNDTSVETDDIQEDIAEVDVGLKFSEDEYNKIIDLQYEEKDFTKDEAYNWVNLIHNSVDTNLIYLKQNNFDINSTEYMRYKESLIRSKANLVKMLSESDHFEQEFHINLIKDVNDYLREFTTGNEDKLFSLKNVIFELDLEVNPNLYKQQRATYISLSDAERIRNEQGPLGHYWE